MSAPRDHSLAEVEEAVERGISKALDAGDLTKPRLLSAEAAGKYLGLSRREIYQMIQAGDLASLKRGRRTMLDVRDLDAWIERNKSK